LHSALCVASDFLGGILIDGFSADDQRREEAPWHSVVVDLISRACVRDRIRSGRTAGGVGIERIARRYGIVLIDIAWMECARLGLIADLEECITRVE
jgi:hypothetical protein